MRRDKEFFRVHGAAVVLGRSLALARSLAGR